MPWSVRLVLVGCLCIPLVARAQEPGPSPLPPGAAEAPTAPPAGGKVATAQRTAQGVIRLDGSLDEQAWTLAIPITDFTQKEPNEGALPTERMEVRFVYNDDALYVGARMYSTNPAAIQAPLGRRDQAGTTAEQFEVSLDTFLNRRTAYTFGVTASGVRVDRYHGSDSEGGDEGFDPVWEASTRVDDRGWTAELWIPFTQLRFNDRPVQVWGLNVRRFTPTLSEETYWVLVPRTEVGWASRFGDLEGIEGVRPSRRVELLPFVVGSTTKNGDRDLADPFDDGKNLVSRMGLDVKVGVGPNLTLDATFNPDFGQVEADPAEVNLSDFATRFPERRPFFTEGSNLLNLSHPNVFYTRRIGAPPAGPASGDYVDRPSDSRIIGAAKLTGRLSSGTSIGILAAVTDEEFAEAADVAEDGSAPGFSRVRVGARAAWGVARVAQELGSSGSSVSFLVGGVLRDFEEEDPLALLSPKYAIVFGNDGLVRFRGGEYQLTWAIVGSYLAGESEAVARVQRSSSHYLQRPDRDPKYLYDPTRESLQGWSMQANFNRSSGQHWLFGASIKIDHPMYDSNEIANLTGADGIMPNWNVTYRETQPGFVFRSYQIRLNQGNEWNFDGNRQAGSAGLNVNVTWLNFWTSSISYSRNFRTESASLTRGGPLMGGPARWSSNLNVGTPPTAETGWSGAMSFSGDELGAHSFSTNMRLTVQPGPRWQLSARPSHSRSTSSQQFVTTLDGGRPETFGSRYIFGYIDQTQYAMEFRLSFSLKPEVNLDIYAEPFTASGHYYDHGELRAPGSLDRITYGEDDGTGVAIDEEGRRTVTFGESTFTLANRDFNTSSFQSNVVLRWEWRPGSTLYLVWQQSRDDRETIGSPVSLGDLFGSISTPGSNIFLVKASFWLPVL